MKMQPNKLCVVLVVVVFLLPATLTFGQQNGGHAVNWDVGGGSAAAGSNFRVVDFTNQVEEPGLPPETPSFVPDSKCDSKKGKGEACCGWYAYGEYLLLRARDAEATYAVQTNSNLPVLAPNIPVQTSEVGVLDQNWGSGFRVGAGLFLDACTDISASYTWFDTAVEDTLVRTGAPIQQIFPMSIHPGTMVGVTGTVAAEGRHDIHFDLIDVDYRRHTYVDCLSNWNYLVGVRYGQLMQDYSARYVDDLIAPLEDANVDTGIDFQGAGVRLGLEGERFFCSHPIMVYGKGIVGLMAGESRATYQQTVQNDASLGVDTAWSAGRIVPTFDLELGTGVYLHDGCLQLTVGYLFNWWGNVVKTEDWINAVQTNDFRDLGDTMTFDGFVARVEAVF